MEQLREAYDHFQWSYALNLIFNIFLLPDYDIFLQARTTLLIFPSWLQKNLLTIMKHSDKTTGWKIPLFFCALALLSVCLLSLAMPQRRLELPEALLAKAKGLHIEPGKTWQEKIVNVGSGFQDRFVKDGKLVAIASEALQQKNFSAVCAAIVQIRNDSTRDDAALLLFTTAMDECTNVAWGVFALQAIKDSDLASRLAERINERWQLCKPN